MQRYIHNDDGDDDDDELAEIHTMHARQRRRHQPFHSVMCRVVCVCVCDAGFQSHASLFVWLVSSHCFHSKREYTCTVVG
jgi:hypothetical protein